MLLQQLSLVAWHPTLNGPACIIAHNVGYRYIPVRTILLSFMPIQPRYCTVLYFKGPCEIRQKCQMRSMAAFKRVYRIVGVLKVNYFGM